MSARERPFVIVNVAQSLDGKIDGVERRGEALSSPEDRARLDRLRAGVDAVMVGGRTLLAEDPRLTIRDPELRKERTARGEDENPAKVGVVSRADLDPKGAFVTAGPARRLVYTTDKTAPARRRALVEAGVEVHILEGERPDLGAVLRSLHELGLQRLLVEGGGTLLAELFRQDLADEVQVFIAARILGGASAPTLADGPGLSPAEAPKLVLTACEQIDPQGGLLVRYSVVHKE